MKLSTSLVAVRKITSALPRSTFAEDELEQAAKLILEAEGVINPIVVRRTSLESYEVVDGHFEYYAAARAREIDLRRGEMIGVFIIEDENEEFIAKQVEAFRKPKSTISGVSDDASSISSNFAKHLKNFELRIETRISELLEQGKEKQKLEDELKKLKNYIEKKIDPLDIFNNLNEAQLVVRLKSTGLSEAKAIAIAIAVESERKKQKFNSLSDVVTRVKVTSGKKQIKGISSDKMLEIVDSWLLTNFV